MFCANCGSQIKNDGKFCGNCGAPVKVNPVTNSIQPSESITSEKPSQTPVDITSVPNHAIVQSAVPLQQPDDKIKAVLARNTAYYMCQFDAILSNGKGKLNWASFFLSFFHAAYRSMWREWLEYMKFPLALVGSGALVTLIGVLLTNPLFLSAGTIWSGIASAFTAVKGIFFAKDFNKLYWGHVNQKIQQGDLSSDISVRAVIIALVLSMAVSACASALTGAALISVLFGDFADSDVGSTISSSSDPGRPEEFYIPSNDNNALPYDPAAENSIVDSAPDFSSPVNLHNYIGEWVVERYNTDSSSAYVTIDSRNDYFFFAFDGVFDNGDKMIWMENVALNFDGVTAYGEYEDDGWGNGGFITLHFDEDFIYLSMTPTGDGAYSLVLSDERCSRY